MIESAALNTADRIRWWLDTRFGISLHWGLYSIPAKGEWIRSVEQMTVRDYQNYFDAFSPDTDCCTTWAEAAATADAGYVVLTAKHHDGFCLWDSSLTDYKSTLTPAARDLIAEYVRALRSHGLRVGFYYSLVDWHHPDFGPVFGDRQHPLRHDPAQIALDRNRDWSRYVRYMHGQIEELLSNYGKIDVLYVDFSYWDFVGQKWEASELVKKIRRLQPDIVINDRFGTEAIKQVNPPTYVGDFDHAEQNIPRDAVCNAQGHRIFWEAWFTINNSWCFDPHDQNYKSTSTIIRSLVNCVSKGGNMCLNISPDAKGQLDLRTTTTLGEVGAWLKIHGQSIKGCDATPFERPEWGRYTLSRDGRHLYAHVLQQQIGHYNLPQLRAKVRSGVVLTTGQPVEIGDYWNPGIQTFDRPGDVFFNFKKPLQCTWPLPSEIDTVVKFELAITPEQQQQLQDELNAQFQTSVARNPF